jgi:membrane protease YdiL (CAAX protease family)
MTAHGHREPAAMTTILIAVATGVVVLLAGNLPWAGFGPVAGLMTRNLALGTTVPWAMLPMTLYLWAYWRFISGAWGASNDAASRRANLRAHRLPSRLWLPSLAAGLLGFATLLALLAVVARVVELPAGAPIVTPPGMPLLTVVVLLAMASVVAGVTEEAAFRGYMQSIVERRYGVLIAILTNGVLFGLLHFGNHPRDVLLMLPYYVAVSAVYGGLTWAADSILPALVLHSVGDVVVLTRWWATGRPEWQLTAIAPQSVWERGIDAAFVVAAVASVVLAVATFWAYRRVHDLRVTTRASTIVIASA